MADELAREQGALLWELRIALEPCPAAQDPGSPGRCDGSFWRRSTIASPRASIRRISRAANALLDGPPSP